MPAEAAAQPPPDAGEGAEAPVPQAPGGVPTAPQASGGIPTGALLGIVVVTESPSVPAAGIPALADHLGRASGPVTRPGIGRCDMV